MHFLRVLFTITLANLSKVNFLDFLLIFFTILIFFLNGLRQIFV